MKLGRLLGAAVSALFLFILVGVEALNLRSAQLSRQQQLESTAQDAATSLGLSLGALLREGADPALAETIINPVFDRGHYQRIEFQPSSGNAAIVKLLAPSQGAYPAWFAALVPLDSPTAESLVSGGWRQLGKVRVTAHPRFAYEQLWSALRDTLVYLALLFAAALMALRLFLREVLRPLDAVEQAAQAISRRDYVTLALRPRTRELARVVDAMNLLSRKVREAIDVEVRRAERLQGMALRDEVTGLLNARGFDARFETLYESGGEPFVGMLAAMELGELAALNGLLGGERCNAMLKGAGTIIAEAANAQGGFAGRWRGSRFIAAFPAWAPARAREQLDSLRAGMRALLGEYGMEERDQMFFAAVGSPRSGGLQAALRLLDEALLRAHEQANGVMVVEEGSLVSPDLSGAVLDALDAKRLSLVGQAASRMSDHRVLHTEIFARLRDASGREIPAAEFIPVVAGRGRISALDRAVIEAVMEHMRKRPGEVSVNLSVRSVIEAEFRSWLLEALGRAPELARRLALELPEHGVVQQQAEAVRFAAQVRDIGAAVALDHFGVHRDSLALMRRMRPAYVKLAAAHNGGVIADPGARFFVESLLHAARQLDIPVIAQNVEDDDMFRALSPLGFSGYQGNVGGRPVPWPAG